MYKRPWIIITSLIFSMLSPYGYSQSESFKPMDDVKQFSESLKSFNRETTTLTSNFRQVKHLDILLEDIVTSGKFYFKKEDKLKWEYLDPFEYAIIFNGNEILIRDENRESRYNTESNQMFHQVSRLMSNVIRGEIMEEEGFLTGYSQNNLEYLVILTPINEQYRQFFQQIEIYLGRADLLVKKLKFTEQSEDFTLIEFSNEKRNEPIPDTVFVTH
jgi:outer membrane lipoprotein-sorting protein